MARREFLLASDCSSTQQKMGGWNFTGKRGGMPDSKAGKRSYRGKVEKRTRENRRKDFTAHFPFQEPNLSGSFPLVV